jgi:hypothetical protein
MATYVQWVIRYPILSALGQFAILGPLGEIVAASSVAKRPALPCSWPRMLGKTAAWAILGGVIKYGFTGMKGFVRELLGNHMLPAWFSSGVGYAFAVSVFTNVLFGPQMMLFHRLEDNLILGGKGYAGMWKAIQTLLWFWIPAHTITFCLPAPYQIGLAALWGLALGVILGLSKKQRNL